MNGLVLAASLKGIFVPVIFVCIVLSLTECDIISYFIFILLRLRFLFNYCIMQLSTSTIAYFNTMKIMNSETIVLFVY